MSQRNKQEKEKEEKYTAASQMAKRQQFKDLRKTNRLITAVNKSNGIYE